MNKIALKCLPFPRGDVRRTEGLFFLRLKSDMNLAETTEAVFFCSITCQVVCLAISGKERKQSTRLRNEEIAFPINRDKDTCSAFTDEFFVSARTRLAASTEAVFFCSITCQVVCFSIHRKEKPQSTRLRNDEIASLEFLCEKTRKDKSSAFTDEFFVSARTRLAASFEAVFFCSITCQVVCLAISEKERTQSTRFCHKEIASLEFLCEKPRKDKVDDKN